jgi:hypothetical protein
MICVLRPTDLPQTRAHKQNSAVLFENYFFIEGRKRIGLRENRRKSENGTQGKRASCEDSAVSGRSESVQIVRTPATRPEMREEQAKASRRFDRMEAVSKRKIKVAVALEWLDN